MVSGLILELAVLVAMDQELLGTEQIWHYQQPVVGQNFWTMKGPEDSMNQSSAGAVAVIRESVLLICSVVARLPYSTNFWLGKTFLANLANCISFTNILPSQIPLIFLIWLLIKN